MADNLALFRQLGKEIQSGQKAWNDPVVATKNAASSAYTPAGSSSAKQSMDYLISGQYAKDTGKTNFNASVLPDGRIIDTTNMTPQQAYAQTLVASGRSDAPAILDSMGLNMDGTSKSTGTFTPVQTASSGSSAPAAPANNNQQLGTVPDLISQFMNQTNTKTDQLMAQFQQALQAMNDENNTRWAQERSYAAEQAKKITDEKKAALQQAITSLTNMQDADLQALNTNVQNAKASLEDRTFQDWLSARQSLANGGMLNSGMRNDAETRLMLRQNGQLADIYGDNQQQLAQTRQRYSDKLSGLNQSLSGISQSDTESQLFRDLYNSGSNQLMEQAKLYSDLIGKTIGYDRLKPGDAISGMNDWTKNQMDAILRSEKQSDDALKWRSELSFDEQKHFDEMGFKYDNLSRNEKIEFAKMDVQNQQFFAKLKSDYELDMTKVMGVDPSGNPTIDAQKLMAEIANNQAKLAEETRHNRASESLSATSNSINAARLQETINKNSADLQVEYAKLRNTQFNQQGAMLYNTTNALGEQIDNITNLLKENPDSATKSALTSQLKTLMNQYDDTAIALRILSDGSSSVTTVYPYKYGGGGR